jgi:hypothetical protein
MASPMLEAPPRMPPKALPDLMGWRAPGRDVPPAMAPKFSTHAGRI